MCLDDLERAYWMGAEIGPLGGYGFQGVALGVDGLCKDGRMGAGCCNFREKGEEGASSNRPELGGHYSQQLLAKTPSYCVMTKQCCVLSRNGWDKEEKQR